MKRIDSKEGLRLFNKMPLLELGKEADSIRKKLHPEDIVTFIIDRNINYTNVCINKCRFCAFYRDLDEPDAYVINKDELFKKIEETIAQGGTQILIQGGLHPDLELSFYIDMLKAVKERFNINIHGFSPPEIYHVAIKSKLTLKETLTKLKNAGLDSIPGGGAEILSDRVREVISPKKIKTSEWIEVMEEAHNLGMRTTATMMFGAMEEPEDIIEHLDAVRNLQDRTGGFTAFIPWSFQSSNTNLNIQSSIQPATGVDYLRVLATSRIYLDNVPNIQASWVTQGLKMAQVSLRFGANDFGSTMIEENVVKAAGVVYRLSKNDIISSIISAEFKAAQRDTYYNILRYFNGGADGR